jgi:hypothetical protein
MSLTLKDKDPISLEIHAAMINSTGSSIARLKKRLKETNMTYQLKPPEDEKMEVWKWEQKIHEMVDYKEQYDFPTVMEIKRARAKRQQGLAESNAEKDRVDADRKALHAALAKEANRKLNILRENKRFGKANTFGGPVEFEPIKTISNYKGMNSIYDGERTLTRKNGVFTRQVGASEIPPWIGPQYYSKLDPKFLAHGLFPDSISEIPFKSLTSGRDVVGRSASELRDAKIIRREKLDSWKLKEPGPRYTKTPERLSPERLLRHHGYVHTGDKFVKDTDTLDSSLYSIAADIRAPLDRRPPLIVLGDLTRQLVMVEKEDMMKSKLPQSKRAEMEHVGASSTKEKANAMLANATSYIATANTLSAKLARHELAVKEALDGGVVNGRIDYTRGALNDIENTGAKVEHTHTAPSITGSDQGSVGTSLLSSKQMMDDNPGELTHLTADVTIASPVKRLVMVSKDTLNGQDSKLGEKLSEEEQAKEQAKAENLRIAKNEEEKRKSRLEKRAILREEYNALSPIKRTFSKRKLHLTKPIQPQIKSWLNDSETVYHRTKEPEWLAPALERQRQEMLTKDIPGLEQKRSQSRYENVEDLFMDDSLRSEIRSREGLKDDSKIDAIYQQFLKETEKERQDEAHRKKQEQERKEKDEASLTDDASSITL